ncbi:hypothetical protein LP7551_05592 [Roseibium album]|nr:hypothetical protein LP7551_05592 [Roseibium album]
MVPGKQDACAQNNALWCDAVLKAAGANSRYYAGFWHASGKVLPLYPNIVTTSARPDPDLKTALDALPENAAVKDSFNCLDLGSFGFRKLKSGSWLFRPTQSSRRPPVTSSWQKITHPEGLKRWSAAWNSDDELHRVFPPRLLEKRAIDFAAILNEGSIKAGGIFNAGPTFSGKDVLGLSNVFCRKNWLYSALHELLAPFPHKPVCTYETDDDVLTVYRQLGFEDCGRLSIWLKN